MRAASVAPRGSVVPAGSVLLIDGRSGAGKTSLARRIAELVGGDPATGDDALVGLTGFAGAQLLHLEDLYPGWSGLAEGSRAAARTMREGSAPRYDWEAGAHIGRIVLDPRRTLIVEGCGAVTRETLAAARAWAARAADTPRASPRADAPVVRSVWVACSEPLRRARALRRDGEMFAPHWDAWAAQEAAHIAAEQPRALVDRIVRVGAAECDE